MYVPWSELGLPRPFSPQRVCDPHSLTRNHGGGGGGTHAGGWGGGGVPIPTTGEKAKHSAYPLR